ncbi:hypothetical protein CISIN_1g0192372mg, partial [Citrus sinensis]
VLEIIKSHRAGRKSMRPLDWIAIAY